MTTYEAISPHHRRIVSTENLWWLDDAWNDRTAQWFSADEQHFAALIRGLRNLRYSGVSEFMPSAEWLAEVCLEAVPDLPLDRSQGKVRSLDVASALAAHTSKNYNFAETLINAASLLASLSDIKRSDFDLNVRYAVNWHIKYQQISEEQEPARRFGIGSWALAPVMQGLSVNRALPGMSKPAHPKTELSLYRWMFVRALRDAVKQDGAWVLLRLLCRNAAASPEDLEFFLGCLDKEMKRWNAGLKRAGASSHPTRDFYSYGGVIAKLKLDELYKTVGIHPNYVSHPYVEALFNAPAGDLRRIHRGAGEAATWGHEDSGYSQSRKDRVLLDSMPRGVLDRRNSEVERFAMEALLDGSKAGLLRKLSNRLGKASQPPTDKAIPQVNYIGLHAPAMGAVFASLDKKYGSEGIPMEWIEGIL